MRCKLCGGEARERSWAIGYCDRCAVMHHLVPEKDPLPMHGIGNTIGVEIECNPTLRSVDKAVEYNCGIKKDGSLRRYGVEFISPVLHESNFEGWVDDMGGILKGAKLYNRCGLHVWIGTKDKSWAEIQQLLHYCLRWQHIICKMVSPSRQPITGHNVSGRPSVIPQIAVAETKKGFLNELYGICNLRCDTESIMQYSKRANDQNGQRYPGPISRYWWFNVHGHWHRRAVEIRLHHGTVDPKKINRWIRVWLNLVEKASSYKNFSKSPLELLPPDLSRYYAKKIVENSKKAARMGSDGFPWGCNRSYRYRLRREIHEENTQEVLEGMKRKFNERASTCAEYADS